MTRGPITDFLDIHLFSLGDSVLTPGTLLTAIAVVLASFVFSRILQVGIRRVLERQGREAVGSVGVAARLLHYGMIVTGFAVALQTAGIKLGALFAAGAVFAVGVGFAMQNLAQNFVSGVLLLVEHSIKPGDIVELAGQVVKVRQMGIRATIVRTLDEEDLIVPNSTLVQGLVKNYTLQDSIYRLRVPVGVSYSSDMAKVRQVLTEVGRSTPFRLTEKPPQVLLVDFGSSSVDWELGVWTDDPWAHRRQSSEIREAIWNAFKSEGIVIAFPQIDVHFDASVDKALSTGFSTSALATN